MNVRENILNNKKNNNNFVRHGNLGLQGGCSACAFSGGVVHEIIANPTVEFRRITGTSGGGLVGASITQPLNKHGYTAKGRNLAQQRIRELWDDISVPDSFAQMGRNVDNWAKTNPYLYSAFQAMLKGQFTKAMAAHLGRTTLNPNALQRKNHVELIINAVDADGHHKLFSGSDLNAQSLMATGAVPSHFHAVRIDGVDYWDGALVGGANPPIKPLLSKKPEFIILAMTNPPEHPITARLQSKITPEDTVDTDGLILHQSYDEIALLLERQEAGDNIPPIHVIFPDQLVKPWTQEEKQMIDSSIINDRFEMGQNAADAFSKAHDLTLHIKSSITLRSLKSQARRFHRSLAIAA